MLAALERDGVQLRRPIAVLHHAKSSGADVLRRRAPQDVNHRCLHEPDDLRYHLGGVPAPLGQAEHCGVAAQVQPKVGLGHDVSKLMRTPRGVQIACCLVELRRRRFADECRPGLRVLAR